ncbi:toxin YoeB [Pedobacter sp. UYEF25]
MEVELHKKATKDFDRWRSSENILIQNKIKQLILVVQKSPHLGSGKPEQLAHELSLKSPATINKEHPIVYRLVGELPHSYSFKGLYK